MQLDAVRTTDTAEFHPVHPKTGEEFDATFILAGPEHPTRRNLSDRFARDARKRVNRAGRFQLDEDPESDRERDTDFLVACVLGWSGVGYDGQPDFPFNAANARKLLTDPQRRWLRDQIQEALAKQELFISSSSSGSSRTPSTSSS